MIDSIKLTWTIYASKRARMKATRAHKRFLKASQASKEEAQRLALMLQAVGAIERSKK